MPHFARTIEPPFVSALAISRLAPALPPSFCLSRRINLSSIARVCMCRGAFARLFACTPVISSRVCMSAPETPAPQKWAWSHGPAHGTRRPLRTPKAPAKHPLRTSSSTPTNSAWTRSGVKWRPFGRGVAFRTRTAQGETPDSQKVPYFLSCAR